MMLALLAIAGLTLGSAVVALTRRDLIHSALLLVLSWAGVAAFYLWAGAEFVAFAQVLIYVGAVSMVVLFAVLLTRRAPAEAPMDPAAPGRVIGALLAAFGVAGVLLGAVLGAPLEVAAAAPVAAISVKQLGLQLMGPHAAALLVVGLLLTVALLGGILLASASREVAPASPEESA